MIIDLNCFADLHLILTTALKT